MIRSHRIWWAIYTLSVAGVCAALSWITLSVLELEEQERQGRAENSAKESIHRALWRVDSWLDVFVDRESLRPYFEYRSFLLADNPYSNLFERPLVGNVATPSPLMTYAAEHVGIHFQIDHFNGLTSPQVPVAQERTEAIAACVNSLTVEQSASILARISPLLNLEQLERKVAAAEQEEEQTFGKLASHSLLDPVVFGSADFPGDNDQIARGKNSYLSKQSSQWQAQDRANRQNFSQQSIAQTDDVSPEPVTVGRLVPLWLDAPGMSTPELFFVRRVVVKERESFQGFLADWDKIQETLQAEVSDLLPQATLVPSTDGISPSDQGRDVLSGELTAIPASLVIPRPNLEPLSLFTPIRTTLSITWASVLLAVAFVGFTLRSSIAFGDKRQRFASAVTHELRTPLTTFRMYSEMLADGMVTEKAQEKVYLNTLKDESNRLATLVENVLEYSRLEKRHKEDRRVLTSIQALFDRVVPVLARRAEAAHMKLNTTCEGVAGAMLHADVEAVSRILFNLVDNSCKYGGSPTEAVIDLQARSGANHKSIEFTVRDRGVGIPSSEVRRVFAPFERATDESGPIPGIGLGLSLSRGLARSLAGDLRFDPEVSPGASFTLVLPNAGGS